MLKVLIIILFVVLVLFGGWVFYHTQYAEEKVNNKKSNPKNGKQSQSKATKCKNQEPTKSTDSKQKKSKDQKLDRGKNRGGKKTRLKSSENPVQDQEPKTGDIVVQPFSITEQIKKEEVQKQSTTVQNTAKKEESRVAVKVVEQNPPRDAVYTLLKISDEHLVEAMVNQQSYYRKWEFKGKYYYEFFCDSTKIGKAINNKSVIVEPFCEKDPASTSYDNAKSIETVHFGEIGADNAIIKKAIIKYK